MSKLEDAAEILAALGMPAKQQNERSCLTLLAMAGLQEGQSWSKTRRPLLRILDMMDWMRVSFGKDYAANSRETIRRQTIHQFEQARLVNRNPDQPTRPTNSGKTVYQLTSEAAIVLKSFGKRNFSKKCQTFIENHGTLSKSYDRDRDRVKVPVTLCDGSQVKLSPGVHNELQRHIIESFAPCFAPAALLVYLGDTAKKRLVLDLELLDRLGIPEMNHDKLPDVVFYDPSKDWLFLIEAVTSHGPVSAKRHAELESMLQHCNAGRIYVTAFMDFTTFRKYASEIVWESEVWIADAPDHMIHFNGDRFMGPYPQRNLDKK